MRKIQEADIEKGEVELECRGAYHWGVPQATDANPNGLGSEAASFFSEELCANSPNRPPERLEWHDYEEAANQPCPQFANYYPSGQVARPNFKSVSIVL